MGGISVHHFVEEVGSRSCTSPLQGTTQPGAYGLQVAPVNFQRRSVHVTSIVERLETRHIQGKPQPLATIRDRCRALFVLSHDAGSRSNSGGSSPAGLLRSPQHPSLWLRRQGADHALEAEHLSGSHPSAPSATRVRLLRKGQRIPWLTALVPYQSRHAQIALSIG